MKVPCLLPRSWIAIFGGSACCWLLDAEWMVVGQMVKGKEWYVCQQNERVRITHRIELADEEEKQMSPRDDRAGEVEKTRRNFGELDRLSRGRSIAGSRGGIRGLLGWSAGQPRGTADDEVLVGEDVD